MIIRMKEVAITRIDGASVVTVRRQMNWIIRAESETSSQETSNLMFCNVFRTHECNERFGD